MERSHITNMLRLLNLPKDVSGFDNFDRKISAGHAKILVNAENSSIIFCKKLLVKTFSVRQTENLVKLYKSPRQKIKNKRPEY